MIEAPFDYCKYHGLGNDYMVIEPGLFGETLPPPAIQALCDRHRGVGADGILLGPLYTASDAAPDTASPGAEPSAENVPRVRIFNPDGSEGEKSGNGLRIFARFLWERQYVTERRFFIDTLGGRVEARVVEPDGSRIAVNMGRVRFDAGAIPVAGAEREVLRETLAVQDRQFTFSAATVGNPHCVVEVDAPDAGLARSAGPEIEIHPNFPNRTNVQFMAVTGPHRIRIEIWERGAGYTLASGTSSCAAAAVAVKLGRCRSPVTVSMPGGELEIRLDADFQAEMEGPVRAVGGGRLADEFLAGLGLTRLPISG